MCKHLISLLVLALVATSPATAFDIKNSATSGNNPAVVMPGEIVNNSTDKRLGLKKIDGTLGYGSLPNALPSGRKAVEQGDGSDLGILLKGSTKPLALSDDTASGYNVARFGVTAVATCAGNDAVDDSIPINAAIDYVSGIGGGTVTFPVGADCRLRNPIIGKNAVRLKGQAPCPNRDNILCSVIRPAVNMTSMVTQADVSVILFNFQVEDLNFDGRGSTDSNAYLSGLTVTYALDVQCIGCQIRNNVFKNINGGGIQFRNTTTAWTNWIQHNQFLGITGWSARLETTDSIFSDNYMTGCGIRGIAGGGLTATQNGSGGCIWAKNFGNIRFINNQIEVANVGVLEESVDTGPFPAWGNSWHHNFIDLTNTAFQMKLGLLGAGQDISYLGKVSGNRFNNSTDTDVEIPSHVVNFAFEDNQHQGTTASSAANFRFVSGGSNFGGSISGQTAFPTSRLAVNAPYDLVTRFSGSGGNIYKLPSLTVGPDTAGQTSLRITAANRAPSPSLEFWGGLTTAAPSLYSRTYFLPGEFALQTEIGGTSAYKLRGLGLLELQRPVILPTYTVATLPTCNSSIGGALAMVTDFNGTPTYNGNLSGGGSNVLMAFCNGVGWTQH